MIDDTMKQIILWIKPPGWQQIYEDAISHRLPSTCSWFFNEEDYKEWESYESSFGSETEKAILLVQGKLSTTAQRSSSALTHGLAGKPGYGKTCICASVIERLKQGFNVPRTASDVAEPLRIAHYLFDNQNKHICSPDSPFRAILVQLLKANIANRTVIDLVSLGMASDEYSHAQSLDDIKATEETVLDLINLLLQRSGPTFIVVDGVDECLDTKRFFSGLERATVLSPK